VVSLQLGHASIAITADVYGHPDEEAAAQAAEIVGRALAGK
jgi:integrase